MANKSRPKQVMFRMSEEEAQMLQKKVEESGLRQQDYILMAVLGKKIFNLEGILEITKELKRQGQNLNQLTKKLYEIGYVDYRHELPQLKKELDNVWQQLRQFLQNQE